MFKFIHAADIHLDSPLQGLSRYESAPVEAIRDACRRAFVKLVDLAIEKEVAFVLLAGDIYDGDWKDYSTGIFFSRQIGRLARHDISVYSVKGNHDAASRMTKALDIDIPSMKLFSHKKVETIKLDDLAVAIHGRSFPRQHVEDNLAAGFGGAINGMFNIGLLHTSLDGREGHANYAPCSLDDLRSKQYQYWALGHIHKREIVSEDPWIVFPGCIQGRHIRETGPKGCVLVSVEEGQVSEVETIALDVFRWTRCNVDLSNVEKMSVALELTRKAIDKEMISADARPIAMRIRYEGETPISEELDAFPERFESRIKAIGAEIADDDLWIEKVENTTGGRLDLDAILEEKGDIAKLLNEILSTPDNPDEIDGLKEAIFDLRQKIPNNAFGEDSVLNLDEDRAIERLIDEAKKMLVARLLNRGDGK